MQVLLYVLKKIKTYFNSSIVSLKKKGKEKKRTEEEDEESSKQVFKNKNKKTEGKN